MDRSRFDIYDIRGTDPEEPWQPRNPYDEIRHPGYYTSNNTFWKRLEEIAPLMLPHDPLSLKSTINTQILNSSDDDWKVKIKG